LLASDVAGYVSWETFINSMVLSSSSKANEFLSLLELGGWWWGVWWEPV
jgi:hypothetical protein